MANFLSFMLNRFYLCCKVTKKNFVYVNRYVRKSLK